jgi:ADP-heptose:LPS heptosyltransferase
VALSAAPPALLVLRALGLGDLLAAVPALRALARAFPEHRRVLAAPAWQAPLVELFGVAHEVVDSAPLAALPVAVRGADAAVNLHGRGPQSTEILEATNPRRLLAFDAHGGPPWRADEHERERWCRLLRTWEIDADAGDFRVRVPPPRRCLPPGTTVIHPGAKSIARRWPAARWARVAAAQRAEGRHVVVTGDDSEHSLAVAVADAAGLPAAAVLAGRTSATDLVSVVASADRVVCGDTGVAHVSYAVGTPSVVLFGPVSPAQWGPPAGGPHIALWHGCEGDPHGTTLDAGLARIAADEVLASLDRLDDLPRT